MSSISKEKEKYDKMIQDIEEEVKEIDWSERRDSVTEMLQALKGKQTGTEDEHNTNLNTLNLMVTEMKKMENDCKVLKNEVTNNFILLAFILPHLFVYLVFFH